jgi:hypothetical protein
MTPAGIYFREKAVHCRCLALLAWNPQLEAELLKLAHDFETEAEKSEGARGRMRQLAPACEHQKEMSAHPAKLPS